MQLINGFKQQKKSWHGIESDRSNPNKSSISIQFNTKNEEIQAIAERARGDEYSIERQIGSKEQISEGVLKKDNGVG